MLGNFPACDRITRMWEGGDVNHPKDPGGLTSRGVTQARGAAYRKKLGLPSKTVTAWTEDEVDRFYKSEFWDTIKGDQLPLGVDLSTYDYGVNSGPSRSVKDLQRVLGVAVDGIIGKHTLFALRHTHPAEIIRAHCDRRLSFLQVLKIWKTFGKGWSRRVADIRAKALAMVLSVPDLYKERKEAEKKGAANAGGAVVTTGGSGGVATSQPPAVPTQSDGIEMLLPMPAQLWWVIGGALLIAGLLFTLYAIINFQQAKALRAVVQGGR